MTASLNTLFLPFESGTLAPKGRTLFIGAVAHPALKGLKPDVWQPFKPLTAGLSAYNNLPDIPSDASYDHVLIHVPKQADEARYWIATGLYALKQGGWIVLAAANDANGNRLQKWLEEVGLVSESLSKNKARVAWAQRQNISGRIDEWLLKGQQQRVQIGDSLSILSQPGVFGWDKIDAGSELLSRYIPFDLSGTGADFGAGTGYLSHHVLEKCPKVSSLYLSDADSRALTCARENLENVRGTRTLQFVWADLTRPAELPALDFVVMNPPFHEGKKTEPGVGQAFIETAAHHLKKGGRLFMVANTHLPYETALREKFSSVKTLAQDKGFKVFEAQK